MREITSSKISRRFQQNRAKRTRGSTARIYWALRRIPEMDGDCCPSPNCVMICPGVFNGIDFRWLRNLKAT